MESRIDAGIPASGYWRVSYLGYMRQFRKKTSLATIRTNLLVGGKMIDTAAAYAISGAGVLLSSITATAIVSFRFGSLSTEVKELRARQEKMARIEDLTPIKKSLTEIKDMFRLELRGNKDNWTQ
jgi:hypothetical protein